MQTVGCCSGGRHMQASGCCVAHLLFSPATNIHISGESKMRFEVRQHGIFQHHFLTGHYSLETSKVNGANLSVMIKIIPQSFSPGKEKTFAKQKPACRKKCRVFPLQALFWCQKRLTGRGPCSLAKSLKRI